MKKYLILLLLTLGGPALHAQVGTQNYIRTRTMLDQQGNSYADRIVYYDGLGRPFQTLDRQVKEGTAAGTPLATLQEYDACGRESRNWLPVATTDEYLSPAAFKTTATGSSGYADANPYALPVYEESPLNRIIRHYGPGAAWHDGHPARTEYLANAATDALLLCKDYSVGTDGSLTENGNYAAGELYVLKETDEDEHATYTFTDKQGRTLLLRRMKGSEAHDTYYVYDIYDNLRFVLQPMYQSVPDPDKYAFRYMYDGRNRCIRKQLPGTGYTEYVYDNADRLTFSQDANQRAAGRWTYYLYDKFSRMTQQGECTGQNASASPTVQIQNYYDTYDFVGSTGFPTTQYTKETDGYAKGSLTGSVLTLSGSSTKIYTAYYYDIKARETKCVQNNLLDGYDVTTTTYTFTSNPATVTHVHTASGKLTRNEVYTYTYDHADRLTKIEHTLGGVKVTLAAYTHDKLGRLQSKSPHGASANKLTYDYNIRDWLTGISGTRFTQNLYYNTGAGTARYNGNISCLTWKAGTESTVRGYKFAYDDLDRMTAATYGETTGINANTNRFSENVNGYDKNGNITRIQRYGQTGASAYGLIDNLTLTLDGNRLSRVDDAATASAYNSGFEFKDAVKQDGEYAYDPNGNLTKDLNKGISNILYNFLNLPSIVTFSDGSTITYTYAANGTKLRTVHKAADTTTTTDYCGNVIYENGVQKLMLTGEGYVTLNDNKYHYYLQDHLGNNRVVINQNGTVEETNHYYPFGGVFASTNSVQPYKYNGKELDAKKGLNWYDYGARYYDAALGRFTTVDPLAEKYYPMSSYEYCGNNPIKYIDPTGMNLTGFTIDKSGFIQKVNNEGGNFFDVIYNKSKYSSKTVKDYDTSGNKTGIKISKGIINELAGEGRNMSAKIMRGDIKDGEGYKSGEYANHAYEIQSDKEALDLMNFLDKNTNVEWGNMLMQDIQGNTVNLLSTSHDVNTIKMGSMQMNKYIRRGFQVIRADHIHPAPGAKASSEDQKHARNIRKHFPKATFRILNEGKYYPYEP